MEKKIAKRYQLTYNVHDDIQGVFDEVQWCAGLIERLKEIAMAKNPDMGVFVDILELEDCMKRANHLATKMFNDEMRDLR